MRALLSSLYRCLPLSATAKDRLRRLMPYALMQPNPALRRFGAVHDLYPWRTDGGLDTRFFIQNFYSIYFPDRDTSTRLTLRCYSAQGHPLAERSERLGPMQTWPLSMRKWLSEIGRMETSGCVLWHVEIPEEVARLPECTLKHAYFVDRGYFCFVKDGIQPSFVHGIDRFAVFQHGDGDRYIPFYPDDRAYVWVPELPLGPTLGCTKLDLITVNRSAQHVEIGAEIQDAEKTVVLRLKQIVAPRGLFLESVPGELLDRLGDHGSLRFSGLPTPWTRVIVMRHFASGAISAMHC